MNEHQLKEMLHKVRTGTVPVEKALEKLKTLPFEDLGFATIDHHRTLRTGFPEVIWGEDKTAMQLKAIIKSMLPLKHPILATRVAEAKARAVKKTYPRARYYPRSRALTITSKEPPEQSTGTILIISAGTSDIPVAEEAAVTARIMGNRVEELYDVGVAGIHRLMSRADQIRQAHVIVVAAGMEGALPSVVGGLVARPVIAVPTSTGYGASFRGVAALLGMLNSCAAGVSVVNIDNGFGAGYVAGLINRT